MKSGLFFAAILLTMAISSYVSWCEMARAHIEYSFIGTAFCTVRSQYPTFVSAELEVEIKAAQEEMSLFLERRYTHYKILSLCCAFGFLVTYIIYKWQFRRIRFRKRNRKGSGLAPNQELSEQSTPSYVHEITED